MYKKLISALLALCILCSPFLLPTFSADKKKSDKKNYDKKISELQKREKEYEAQLKKTRADIQAKEQYSATLVKQIEVLGKQIRESHAEIEKLNKKISKKQKEIKEGKNQIETQIKTLKKRIRAIYMAGNASSLEIVLGARDFGDFVDKLTLIKTLSTYDQKLIETIKSKLATLSKEKKDLENTKAKRLKSEKLIEEKQNKLNKMLKENKKLLARLYDVKKAYENHSDYVRGGTGSGSGSAGAIHVTPSGFSWPVPNYYAVVSPFGEDRGYTHKGIDISGGGILGARVIAVAYGTVTSSNNTCIHNWGKSGSCGCGGGYGNFVCISHDNGKQTLYGHLSDAMVSTGAEVKKGQTIGYVGSTGWSTGPHLHFECRLNGVHYNPMREY